VQGLLDWPHYTRPEVFEGVAVPGVLLSGDHADIHRWRLEQALVRTARRRPDLLRTARLSGEARRVLSELQARGSLAAAAGVAAAAARDDRGE
jgi:tRNA (guanine37-N1)-methyltransferase